MAGQSGVPVAGDVLLPRRSYHLAPPFGYASDKRVGKIKVLAVGETSLPGNNLPLMVLGSWYETVPWSKSRVRVWYAYSLSGHVTFTDPRGELHRAFSLARVGANGTKKG